MITGASEQAPAAAPKHWLNRNILGMGLAILGYFITATIESSQPALASTLMHEDQNGTSFGLMSAVDRLGDFLSGVAMGTLWPFVSPNAGFTVAGIPVLVSALILGAVRLSSASAATPNDIRWPIS